MAKALRPSQGLIDFSVAIDCHVSTITAGSRALVVEQSRVVQPFGLRAHPARGLVADGQKPGRLIHPILTLGCRKRVNLAVL